MDLKLSVTLQQADDRPSAKQAICDSWLLSGVASSNLCVAFQRPGFLIGRRGGRVMMQMMIHARYNKFQPEEEEDKAEKLQIWCFSPDGGSSVFFSCDPNAINGDFTNVSRGRIMSHSKMSQTLS